MILIAAGDQETCISGMQLSSLSVQCSLQPNICYYVYAWRDEDKYIHTSLQQIACDKNISKVHTTVSYFKLKLKLS